MTTTKTSEDVAVGRGAYVAVEIDPRAEYWDTERGSFGEKDYLDLLFEISILEDLKTWWWLDSVSCCLSITFEHWRRSLRQTGGVWKESVLTSVKFQTSRVGMVMALTVEVSIAELVVFVGAESRRYRFILSSPPQTSNPFPPHDFQQSVSLTLELANSSLPQKHSRPASTPKRWKPEHAIEHLSTVRRSS